LLKLFMGIEKIKSGTASLMAKSCLSLPQTHGRVVLPTFLVNAEERPFV